jgi:hypothetical protein
MILDEWADDHGISEIALIDLKQRMGVIRTDPVASLVRPSRGEAAVSTDVRLEAAGHGIRLFRNNVGCAFDKTGRPIRYGLCNESKAMNKVIKSHDLVGIRSVLITQAMVNRTIGQFITREAKHREWVYSGNEHEVGQQNFSDLINSLGGDAKFVTGKGSFD